MEPPADGASSRCTFATGRGANVRHVRKRLLAQLPRRNERGRGHDGVPVVEWRIRSAFQTQSAPREAIATHARPLPPLPRSPPTHEDHQGLSGARPRAWMSAGSNSRIEGRREPATMALRSTRGGFGRYFRPNPHLARRSPPTSVPAPFTAPSADATTTMTVRAERVGRALLDQPAPHRLGDGRGAVGDAELLVERLEVALHRRWAHVQLRGDPRRGLAGGQA